MATATAASSASQQRDEVQELLRAVQRLAHLGAAGLQDSTRMPRSPGAIQLGPRPADGTRASAAARLGAADATATVR
jgi:hypothetical protein